MTCSALVWYVGGMIYNNFTRRRVSTALLTFLIILFGCNINDVKNENENYSGDQTCWAHTASDLIHYNGIGDGEETYKAMVDKFGNKPFWVKKALKWWFDKHSIEGWKIRDTWKGNGNGSQDMKDEAYWLFEDGSPVVGFRVKDHYMAAFSFSTIDAYDHIKMIIWLEKAGE